MLATLRTFDIRVEYWLRRGTPAEFEKAFVQEVMTRLRRDWWFTNPVFGSRKGMVGRRELYAQPGMLEVATLWNQDQTRRFHFHRPTSVELYTL
jgi:hypothetical protein|uniref:Uncharacterized protein n=1 Tax=Meiothermus ruber TaxID=277 RepID=A0A7C3DPI0_MEIRU